MTPLVCRLIGHKRSRRDARWIDHRWISYCRHCGALMVRQGPRQWAAVRFVDGIAIEPDPAGPGLAGAAGFAEAATE
jgi:hypothetical protein